MQSTFWSYEAISFIFWILSFQIYNFRTQINVEASGATDVIKHLKLRKITNSLWEGKPEAAKKLLFFTIFISSQ